MIGIYRRLATLFVLGYSPFAPGTVGTMLGLPVYFLLSGLSWPLFAVILVVVTIISVPICGRAARDYFEETDPSPVVLDELVGFLVTMAFHEPTTGNLAMGFIFFRFFDIAKFWPMSAAEKKLAGGLGIVADDVLAGVLANLCLIIANLVIY